MRSSASRTQGAARAAAIDAGLDPTAITHAADLPAAVGIARTLATPGTAVLLSPAAASYNVYDNFEQRGEHFATLVGARRHSRPAGDGPTY